MIAVGRSAERCRGSDTTIALGRTAALLPTLSADWLLMADRGFYSFEAYSAAALTGAALCWPAPTQLRLPVVEVLADGTYLSVLIDPKIRGPHRERLLAAAKSGAKPDPAAAHVVRIVEYDIPNRDSSELITLITNIHDPADVSAAELAGSYQQRRESEASNGQLKTWLRGLGRVLRSRSPDLVHQEVWAYLLGQHAVSALICQAATGADIDLDRVSFVKAVHLVRRTATGTVAFPLSTGPRPPAESTPTSPPAATSTRRVNPAAIPVLSNEPATTPTGSKDPRNEGCVTPSRPSSSSIH